MRVVTLSLAYCRKQPDVEIDQVVITPTAHKALLSSKVLCGCQPLLHCLLDIQLLGPLRFRNADLCAQVQVASGDFLKGGFMFSGA